VLKLIRRISLSLDRCVRQTGSAFERHGAPLVAAKFTPGATSGW
jgi:hypothetical protein